VYGWREDISSFMALWGKLRVEPIRHYV